LRSYLSRRQQVKEKEHLLFFIPKRSELWQNPRRPLLGEAPVAPRDEDGTMKSGAPVELQPRKRPTQQRARNLVDKILDTTATLLDEVGLEALTTNLIAERADIRVSSIYRYFPNKHAIMVALWERLASSWLELLGEFMGTADNGRTIPDLVDVVVETAALLDRTQPGVIPLLRAMRATPELHEVEVRSNRTIAERIAQFLAERGAAIPKQRMGVVARMLTESTSTVLELSLSVDEGDETFLIDELKRMLRNYLADYFPDNTVRERGRLGVVDGGRPGRRAPTKRRP
jgi:AcrR family transcriptional regulator